MSGRSLEEFAALAGLSTDMVIAYRDAGLIDVRGKGSYSDRDVLAVHYIRAGVAEGLTVGEMAEAMRSSDDPIIKRMYQRSQYSLEEAAAKMGRNAEEVRASGVALGFSNLMFDDDDIAAFALIVVAKDAGIADSAIFEAARVFGDGLRRLADEIIAIAHRSLCEPRLAAGEDAAAVGYEMAPSLADFGSASLGLLRHLYIDYLVRALSEHAVRHLEPAHPDAPPGMRVATVVFADLALFSTLAELEGDEAAVALVDRTDAALRKLVLRHHGHLVKHIGDEFMLIFDRSIDAIRFAVEMRSQLAEKEREAAVRIGIHEGPVLHRLGDYYGRAVNAAARIVSMAVGNSILITEPIAAAAREHGLHAEELGVRTLRGMEQPLTLYRLTGG